MKLFGGIVFLGASVLLVIQIFLSFGRLEAVNREFREVDRKLERVQADFGRLQEDFIYFLNPENLEKELRARFNYRREGEKMIIIVPRTPTSSLPETSP